MPDVTTLADRLATQPALCLEVVGRLGVIAGLAPTAETAGKVIAWAKAVLSAVNDAPDPVLPPDPTPVVPPPPLPPTGRAQIRVYPDPASHYYFWAVDPSCVPLARSLGLLEDADAGSVPDSEVVYRCRGVLPAADVLFTADTPGADG